MVVMTTLVFKEALVPGVVMVMAPWVLWFMANTPVMVSPAFKTFNDAAPVRDPVIVPAAKLPEPSLATIALVVLDEVAVVAELETFKGVEMVANLVSAMAAIELISASTMEEVDRVPFESVCTTPAELRLAKVMVPAVKLPEPSRATMALRVLDEVAVVAELETFKGVEMVANLVSAIAAEELISASTIEDVDNNP